MLYTDESRSRELGRLPMLRQQAAQPSRTPNRSLASFVAPVESGVKDWIGGFAVTGGLGADALAARYESENDDYRALLVKSVADRLAEALAEKTHREARRAWYAPGEELGNEELIAEKFRGIRPAFGYPACPDHTPKRRLFDWLGAEGLGIELTENLAMTPAASVSGLYLGHPKARYFTVGRIGRDQLEDYAARSGRTPEEMERWLQPNLG